MSTKGDHRRRRSCRRPCDRAADARRTSCPLRLRISRSIGVRSAEHRWRVLDQVVVFELMGEIRDRPALVGRRDAEQIGDPVGEALDAQARIEEQRAEIGRRHQVLQVAVGARDRLELQLQLAVDGLQLLVDRLQLFLAGLQLLGGRAVFLVDRLQLFVGGAQLLVGGLRFLAHRAQPRLRQFATPASAGRTISFARTPARDRAGFRRPSSPSMNITTRCAPLRCSSGVDGLAPA